MAQVCIANFFQLWSTSSENGSEYSWNFIIPLHPGKLEVHEAYAKESNKTSPLVFPKTWLSFALSYTRVLFLQLLRSNHRHNAESLHSTHEVESMKELLYTFEQSVKQKDEVIRNLTDMLGKQVMQFSFLYFSLLR